MKIVHESNTYTYIEKYNLLWKYDQNKKQLIKIKNAHKYWELYYMGWAYVYIILYEVPSI